MVGGSKEKQTNAEKGGGGPKSRKFCGRPLCMVPYFMIHATWERPCTVFINSTQLFPDSRDPGAPWGTQCSDSTCSIKLEIGGAGG